MTSKAKATAAEPPKTFEKRLVCIGLVKTVDSKKLMPEFAEVNDIGNVQLDLGTVVFDLKATPGHVYSVQASQWGATGGTKTIQPSTLRWVAQYHDAEKRMEWEAATDLLRARLDSEKARARAEKSTALREAVKPLAKVYSKLIATSDQRAFLAMVVAEIVNPRNAKET